jgi:histidine ammonia-lyase
MSDSISHGTPAAFRAYIHEMAGLAAIQAELAMQYAELGDDVGLVYALRRWVAYTRAAVATAKDLKSMKEEAEGAHHAGEYR